MGLENGARLPTIRGLDLDGNDVDITESLGGTWAALLLYRGHW